MNKSKSLIRPLVKTHGGKFRYSKYYIKVINNSGFNTYVEPYAGGLGVLLNIDKNAFIKEIANDFDPNIYRMYTAIQEKGDLIVKEMKKILYNNENFEKSISLIGDKDPVKHALYYIIRNRFSSGGMFKRFAKTDTSVRLRGGRMGDENAWINFYEKHINNTIKRLANVEFYNCCALNLIKNISGPNVLWFLDPPYLNETLVTKDPYVMKVDKKHHENLLKLITTNKGRFYICGYNSDLYQDYLKGWKVFTFDRVADSGRTKQKSRRIEYLWESPY